MFQTLSSPLFLFTVIAIPISLVIHEFAHAVVADWFGDPTPRLAGRVTLNPLPHLDALGLLMILFGPIGWAKPTPVNPQNFKRPRLAYLVTVLAGPLSNLILASISFLLLRWVWNPNDVLSSGFLTRLLNVMAVINVNLFVFNLIPVPPLDGSRILETFVLYRHGRALRAFELYGPFILLLLVMIPPLQNHVLAPVFNGALNLVASWFGFQFSPIS